MAGFANPQICNGLRQLRDVALYIIVEQFPRMRIRFRAPPNEMPWFSGSTSLSMVVACRYGRWAAHYRRGCSNGLVHSQPGM